MTGKRVLVVDDETTLRRVTQVQLEQEGYVVSTAASGHEALGILENTSQDLVVTDLRMPGMSGMDLLRQIRAHHPNVAVIIVTAYGSHSVATEAIEAGAYDCIAKPVNPDMLRSIVRRAFEYLALARDVPSRSAG
jgi:DNA-binding NtrC family response regulator